MKRLFFSLAFLAGIACMIAAPYVASASVVAPAHTEKIDIIAPAPANFAVDREVVRSTATEMTVSNRSNCFDRTTDIPGASDRTGSRDDLAVPWSRRSY